MDNLITDKLTMVDPPDSSSSKSLLGEAWDWASSDPKIAIGTLLAIGVGGAGIAKFGRLAISSAEEMGLLGSQLSVPAVAGAATDLTPLLQSVPAKDLPHYAGMLYPSAMMKDDLFARIAEASTPSAEHIERGLQALDKYLQESEDVSWAERFAFKPIKPVDTEFLKAFDAVVTNNATLAR